MTEIAIDLSSRLLTALSLQLTYTAFVFLLCSPALLYFRTRNPLAVTCLCWLVLCRLILPVDISSQYSLRALVDWVFSGTHVETASIAANTLAVSPPLELAPAQFSFFDVLTPAIVFAWFVLSLIVFWRFTRERIRLLRIAQSASTAISPRLQELFRLWVGEFKLRGEVKLAVTDKVKFAYTIGVTRPFVVLPQILVERENLSDLQAVIAHELGHVARKDDLWIQSELVLRSVLFFFPVAWACHYFLALAREQLCDRLVLEHKTITRAAYGTSLLNVLHLQQNGQVPASVASFGRVSLLRSRIMFLRNGPASVKPKPALYVGLFTAVALLLWPMASHTKLGTIEPHGTTDNATFSLPVTEGRLASAFGHRVAPTGDGETTHFHKGIDIAGVRDQPIYAVASGKVIEAKTYSARDMPAWGNYLVIQHKDGYISRYTHLTTVSRRVGESVRAGQRIGSMGDSGQATGVHLHLELIRRNEYLDPKNHIAFDRLSSKG